MICPICGAETCQSLEDLVHCRGCGLFIKTTQPPMAEVKNKLRNASISAVSVPRRWILRVGTAMEQFSWIHYHLNVEPGRMFDVGASGGFLMNAAEHFGWEPEGNELSQQSIQWCLDHFNYGLQYGDITELQFLDGHYRLFTLWHSLEHMVSPTTTLEILSRALEPGGAVALAVPWRNTMSPEAYESMHFYEFSYRSLDALFERYGFTRTHSRNLDVQDVKKRQINAIYQRG